jgi:hypothetical protein
MSALAITANKFGRRRQIHPDLDLGVYTPGFNMKSASGGAADPGAVTHGRRQPRLEREPGARAVTSAIALTDEIELGMCLRIIFT